MDSSMIRDMISGERLITDGRSIFGAGRPKEVAFLIGGGGTRRGGGS